MLNDGATNRLSTCLSRDHVTPESIKASALLQTDKHYWEVSEVSNARCFTSNPINEGILFFIVRCCFFFHVDVIVLTRSFSDFLSMMKTST